MTTQITEVITNWKGGMAFIGENASGGKVQMGTLDDTPGVGPMQLLLFGLAGCTGMDIISILEKKRKTIHDFKMVINATRAGDFPMIWTDIHIKYLLWSENTKSKDLEQAIRLSEEKYCSVGIMLGKSAAITSEYQILKSGELPVNN